MHADLDMDEMVKRIKQHIGITWSYQDDDVKSMIEDGIAKIEAISVSTDFESGLGWKLLKAYCRYAWDGSEAYFEENYKRDLIQLQIQNMIKQGGGDV